MASPQDVQRAQLQKEQMHEAYEARHLASAERELRLECLRLAMETLNRNYPSYPPDSGLQTHFSGSDLAVIATASRYWRFVSGSLTELPATDAA